MKNISQTFLFFILLLIVWAGVTGDLAWLGIDCTLWSPYVLPSPTLVAQYLWDNTANGKLPLSMLITLRRLLIGYLIGLVIGVPLGMLAARFTTVRNTVGVLALGFQGLPASWVREKTDAVSNNGFMYSNAGLNEDEVLLTDGIAGAVLYGPYTESVPGVYDITLNYEIIQCDGTDEGYFDVALDMQSIAMEPFDQEKNSVTLRDVPIGGGHQFEARVSVPDGMVMEIKSVNYVRTGNENAGG